MLILFAFFHCRSLTDEWQEALCRCTGQPYDPNPALRRWKSELPAVTKRRKRTRERSRTTLPDIVVEQVSGSSVGPGFCTQNRGGGAFQKSKCVKTKTKIFDKQKRNEWLSDFIFS